jgi:hypothetical protein
MLAKYFSCNGKKVYLTWEVCAGNVTYALISAPLISLPRSFISSNGALPHQHTVVEQPLMQGVG